jgi:hypothetical protein
MSGFTVLFGIVGFVGTSIYDTFMVVCVRWVFSVAGTLFSKVKVKLSVAYFQR